MARCVADHATRSLSRPWANGIRDDLIFESTRGMQLPTKVAHMFEWMTTNPLQTHVLGTHFFRVSYIGFSGKFGFCGRSIRFPFGKIIDQ